MIFKQEADLNGIYINAQGERISLLCCRRIRNAEGINAGWQEFPSLEVCMKAMGLSLIETDSP